MSKATDAKVQSSGRAGRAVVHDADGADAELVVAIDTLVEGVHFPRATLPEDLGFKALAVNLSDLAAMGAEPRAARVSLTLAERDDAWCAAFERGLEQLARRFAVSVAHETPARGPLCVTVEALGSVPHGMALRRSGAAPGDRVLVTGTLGDAGLALDADDTALTPRERAWLQARLARPEPRVEAGMALRGLASAAIDISDGLAADLGHILAASHVGARIDVDRLPLSAVLEKACPREQALSLALAAGDDYELCFTVAEARRADAERCLADADVSATCIGRVTAGAGLTAEHADASPFEPPPGYRHFP